MLRAYCISVAGLAVELGLRGTSKSMKSSQGRHQESEPHQIDAIRDVLGTIKAIRATRASLRRGQAVSCTRCSSWGAELRCCEV